MNSKVLTLTSALLISVAASAQVSDYSQLRTNSWSIYGLGGVSAATGEKLFENVSPSPDTYVAPMVGAGITYNIRPWLRLNLGYETSKYLREQRFGAAQADGLTYRNLEVLYNDVEFNGELNIAQFFREKGTSGRFNAYIGTGIGEMFAYGYDYTVKMGEKLTVSEDKYNDNYTFKAWLEGHNDDIAHMSPYIPANLSIEYDVTPRFTLGVRGSVKYILNKDATRLPTLTESVGAVLRVNFVGNKQGYRSKAKQIAALDNELAETAANLQSANAQNADLSKKLSDKSAEAETLKKNISDMSQYIEDCGADKATVERLRQEIRDLKAEQYTVYFANASAVLDKKAKAVIADAVAKLNSDPEALTVITASCNTLGGEEYNKDLSDRRAAAVRQALIESGISADRISDIISLGKEGMTASDKCRRAIIDVR